MYKLQYKGHFDAAHRLNLDYESNCTNLHGHRWEVIVRIKKNELNSYGMIIDFRHIKGELERFDHKVINEVVPDINPTAENIAKYIQKKIKKKVGVGSRVSVTVYESPKASVNYEEN